MTTATESSEIKNIITRALEQNPENREIIKAFAPIIMKQRQLAESSFPEKLDCSLIDKEKLKAGVPVIRQIELFLPEDSLKEIALSMADAVKEGMPQLTENINKISNLIQEGKINPFNYFQTSKNNGNKVSDSYCETQISKTKCIEICKSNNPAISGGYNTPPFGAELGSSPDSNRNCPGVHTRDSKDLKVSPSNATFLMSLVNRVALEKRAREITAAVGSFDWEKGYCPICGEFPSIALIEEEGGKRFLHCSSCGQDWRFTRISCPYCEKETPKDMEYFYIENKTQEAAFVCDKCKKYLVTLYRAGKVFARDMDVSAISLIHMDMIMQDKGYKPMTICPWNILT
ncbi:MAG: formate dehydrogenase accessory protein FdhE [Syntrophaceae bacterium]|nr:formate dehydrogenase accessory protein FdhE [Syntrophaceae bacterium]